MSKLNSSSLLGMVVGLGLGTAVYFAVVYILPSLGKLKWIWT
jgi:hypothetical protein